MLLAEAAAAGLPVGLTGIGYDGEDVDHVTGLPKPRIPVPRGTWPATARDLAWVVDRLHRPGARLVLVDGAFGRTPGGQEESGLPLSKKYR